MQLLSGARHIQVNNLKISEILDASELTAIAALEKTCFFHSPWNIGMLSAAMSSPYRHIFALSNEEAVVGYAIIQLIGDEGEIERIGITPHKRGQSFGKNLLVSILNIKQMKTCFLEVSKNNTVAYHLYQTCGFEEIGRRTMYYQDGSDAIMMKWKRTTNE